MKRKLVVLTSLLALTLIIVLGVQFNTKEGSAAKNNSSQEELKAKHASYLDNSPFKETQKLSRSERKAMGLPPNAYNE